MYADSTNGERVPIARDAALTVSYGSIGTQTNRKFADYNLLEDQQQALTPTTRRATFDFLDSLHKSFLPGLGLGVLVTSIVVLIWGAARLHQNVQHRNSSSNDSSSSNNNSSNNNGSRPNTPTATTCYAASEHIARLADAESGARYLKLQATTTL